MLNSFLRTIGKLIRQVAYLALILRQGIATHNKTLCEKAGDGTHRLALLQLFSCVAIDLKTTKTYKLLQRVEFLRKRQLQTRLWRARKIPPMDI